TRKRNERQPARHLPLPQNVNNPSSSISSAQRRSFALQLVARQRDVQAYGAVFQCASRATVERDTALQAAELTRAGKGWCQHPPPGRVGEKSWNKRKRGKRGRDTA